MVVRVDRFAVERMDDEMRRALWCRSVRGSDMIVCGAGECS